jgi:FkbM family methyltransferase
MDIVSNSSLIHLFHTRFGIIPDYERVLEATYRLLIKPGDTVIDIGAHIGRHTRCFAELVGPTGRVLAFEPLPHCYERLVADFPEAPVRAWNLALADTEGTSNFVYARGQPEESGLKERIFNYPELADPTTITVQVRTLDSFLDEIVSPLAFIKIDTEGAEIAILRGATTLLTRHRPVVSVEYGKPGYSVWGHEAATLFDLAQSLNYCVADIFGALCPDRDSWEKAVDYSYWDWFLVPQERVDFWKSGIYPR